MSAPSAEPAEGNTSASRVMEQTEEQRQEVRAQSTFVDAMAHGKAIVIAEAANSGPTPRPEEEPEEDKVEEVLGHPQDERQHVYVSRWRNDQWVVHEEIPEVEETKKVEQAAKQLVTEVQVGLASPPDLVVLVKLSYLAICTQDLMKTARYRKKCFDQIEGVTASNKELTAEVERLRQ